MLMQLLERVIEILKVLGYSSNPCSNYRLVETHPYVMTF